MLTRKTFVALAAVAALGALGFATNDASARAFGGAGVRMGGAHVNSIKVGGPHRISLPHRPSHNIGLRPIRPGHGIGLRPHHPPPIFGHHRPHFRWGWRHRYWVAPVVTTGVATGVLATGPAWNRCNCLTKEYTPDGAVVFKDLCTQEMAMNPPAVAPSADELPQGPAVTAPVR